MAERNYKVNEPIKVLYQAPNRQSGLTDIVGEIYLPNGSKDSNFPDVSFTERGNSGTYSGSFTPDALGEWQVIVHQSDGSGQVTKQYSVGYYDVTGVGVAVEEVETKIDTVDTKVDTVETKIDILDTKVSSLDTPPMIS